MDLVHKVRQTIIDEQLLQSGDVVIVAVSGGPDSVALLHVLNQLSSVLNIQLIVAHVNHQFRGKESDEEAEGVLKLSEKLGLLCEIGAINVPEFIKDSGMNTQAAAREKRYEFLRRIAEKYHASKVALAHHADDQAETMIMRIIRGSGISGLAGIPIRRKEKKVELIRPLLRIYKSELLHFCSQQSLIYAEDSSNAERKYFRNQVRLDIIPYLRQWNNQLPQSLNRLAEMMKDEDDYLTGVTMELLDQSVIREQGDFCLSRNLFLRVPSALQRRLIKLILSYLSTNIDSIDYKSVELARAAIKQGATPSMELDLGSGIAFMREYDQIRFGSKKLTNQVSFNYVIDQFPSEIVIQGTLAKMSFQVFHRKFHDEIPMNNDKNQAYFDLEKISLPITIRNRRQGDRIKMVGLNGSKKVKNIFIDEKVAPSQREQIPIVVNTDDQVLWIPGLRLSDHGLVTEQTTRILHMKYNEFIY